MNVASIATECQSPYGLSELDTAAVSSTRAGRRNEAPIRRLLSWQKRIKGR